MLRDDNIQAIRDGLTAKGRPYEFGNFARVYVRPKSNTVVKIAYRDDSYRWFLKFMDTQDGSNPHFPQIRAIHTTDDFTYVVMERLDPIAPAWPNEEACREFEEFDEVVEAITGPIDSLDWPREFCEESYSAFDYMADKFYEAAIAYVRGTCGDHPLLTDSFIRTCVDLCAYNYNTAGRHWDLHDQNVMLRTGSTRTLVITDPFS